MSHPQHRQPDLGSLPPADFQLDLGTRIGVVNAVAPNTSHHATLEELAGWLDEHLGDNASGVIDSHISDDSIHFLEASINHVNIQSIGTNPHAAIDSHIADGAVHFLDAPFLKTDGSRAMTGRLDVKGAGAEIRGPAGEMFVIETRQASGTSGTGFRFNFDTQMDSVGDILWLVFNNSQPLYEVRVLAGPIIKHEFTAESVAGAAVEFVVSQPATGGKFILEATGASPQSLTFENTANVPEISSTGFGISLIASKDKGSEETLSWFESGGIGHLQSAGNDLGTTGGRWKDLFLSNDLLIDGKMVLGQATADYTITWDDPAAARAISIPDPLGTDVFVLADMVQTLRGKTLILGGDLDGNGFDIAINSASSLFFDGPAGAVFIKHTTAFNILTLECGPFYDIRARTTSGDGANTRFGYPSAATPAQGFQLYQSDVISGANERLRISTLPHLFLAEAGATPNLPVLASGTGIYFYHKADKVVYAFNDGGVVRYKYLLMTGTGVTWVHTTTAP